MICSDCDGTGVSHDPEWLDDPPVDTCATCGGSGVVCRPGQPVHDLTRYPDGVAVCTVCKKVVEFPGREGEPPSGTWARWKEAVRMAHRQPLRGSG
jgi:hypothetical protein